MDERMKKLDAHFEGLKARGEGLPSQIGKDTPHFRTISSVTGIEFRCLIKEPYRARVMLAAEKLGFAREEDTFASRWEDRFNQNNVRLDNYFRWLEDNGHKLPEDPTRGGKVFLAQVGAEANLSTHSLGARKNKRAETYNARLREKVEKAATLLGVEVRVLPQSPGREQKPLTYRQLFERGTEERKKQLTNSTSAQAQLYNTRHGLRLFLKTLSFDETASIGNEFLAGFKSSVEKVTGEVDNRHSRKKFQTEIHWWRDTYLQLIKESAIPDDLHQAIVHLVDRSGLSLFILGKLIGVGSGSLEAWYRGDETPSMISIKALSRMEALFKIPAGTLTQKVRGMRGVKRFRMSDLPPFLLEQPKLFRRISRYLPDDFCALPLEKQEQIVESIQTEALRCDDYSRQLWDLCKLEYRLKVWPEAVSGEFDSCAEFKMAVRPPLGMRRSGRWKPTTKRKTVSDLSFFFGALCLPPDAVEARLRGVGLPESHLTLALLACPKIVDWYIRFRCEARTQYTEYAVCLLNNYISLLWPGTGWLRQSPQLAARLRPFGDLVPVELVSQARTNWDAVCDAAIKRYNEVIEEIEPLITVARDSFHRIEGILDMEDPMAAYELLARGMKDNLPNRHTQPVLYHTAIRDLALVILIAATGIRRGTVAKLNYTGDTSGQLFTEGDSYVLSIPREFFKRPDSSFFGPPKRKKDYKHTLPNVYGLNEVFREYLEVSRPFLMERYPNHAGEQPLFVIATWTGPTGTEPGSVRLRPERITQIYTGKMDRHLAENKHRGTGIPKVKRTGPHSVRQVRGTTVYRKTRSFKLTGDANQNSEQMARKHYSRETSEEKNQDVNQILFDEEE